MIVTVSIVISVAVYYINSYMFLRLFPKSALSTQDALFVEGVLLLIIGVLFFIGYGGLTGWTFGATVLSSAASAVSGKETVGPKEIMKRDAWKPKGHLRTALVLIIASVILFAIYFLT